MGKNNIESEFEFDESSFMFLLKEKLIWRHDRFIALLEKMIECCDNIKNGEENNNYLAQGFWNINQFVKKWTQYEGFRKINPKPEVYYEMSYEVLESITFWYFNGECPYASKKDLMNSIKYLDKHKY